MAWAVASICAAACGSRIAVAETTALEGTAIFYPPAEIAAADPGSPLARHAVTRLVDWNGDDRLDLLVADKQGRVRIFTADGERPTTWEVFAWSAGRPVRVGERDLTLDGGNTTACFVDLSGDGLPDLVAAHDDVRVAWAPNVGSRKAPAFAELVPLIAAADALQLPKGCGARIDVGDWNGDGLADLVAGHFSGAILWYRNTGTPREPRFAAEPIAIRQNGRPRTFSYNVHPTLFDVNQDGRLDLAYGINWGTIGVFLGPVEEKKRAAFDFDRELALATIDGPLKLREAAGDDTTPTFGDLDGDGTLDLVSGGDKGKLWRLRGVSLRRSLDEVRAVFERHGNRLGPALKDDAALRERLVARLHGLYDYAENFATAPAARKPLADWLTAMFEAYPQLLRRGRHDIEREPYVPWIAYQFWTLRMLCHDGDPDAPEHRRRTAEAIGFDGRLKEILVEFGTLIVENGRATPNQQQTLYSYLTQIPPILLNDRRIGKVTEVITIADYLGPRLEVRNAGGVNIFDAESGKPGSSENSFPDDFAPMTNDYFGLVLAHELNHRVDATRFTAVPEYDLKYRRHLRKACGPDVVFREPITGGVDWDATKNRFRAAALWDGRAESWDTAWEDYWISGPGASRVLNVCRNRTTYRPRRHGIPFFLETRQESIASLANQYFSDSVHMFEFALDRYRRGASGALDEWLLMADVYSLGGPTTLLYKHANGETDLRSRKVPIERDPAGNIRAVTVADRRYEFELDAEGLVDRVWTTTPERREIERR